MTKFIRRRSYIKIEEDEEVWIFEDELPASENGLLIDNESRNDNQLEAGRPRSSSIKRLLIFVLSAAVAIATSLAASVIYDTFIK